MLWLGVVVAGYDRGQAVMRSGQRLRWRVRPPRAADRLDNARAQCRVNWNGGQAAKHIEVISFRFLAEVQPTLEDNSSGPYLLEFYACLSQPMVLLACRAG